MRSPRKPSARRATGKRRRRYVVIFEKGKSGYGATVPDLPGCNAAAKTRVQTRKLIREAIAIHIEGLERDGKPVPEPTCTFTMVKVR